MNAYIQRVLDETRAKNANEPEFLQTVEEVLTSLEPVINAHPEYEAACLLERMVEPERTIEFRVVWMDDQLKYHVNRGYRVQYNAALGPYKGGLRFASNVNLSIIKFLGFEQTFKDALTCLPIGGAKGGSDFSPIGRSDGEVMRFCQAFMTEFHRHIGQDIDCPAGDVGVGGREVGYLYGQYRRIVGAAEFGAMSGKAVCTGGSILRPEATGFGAVYYLREVLKHDGKGIKGLRVAMSGYGNVGWGIMKKIDELGGKVTYFAGPDGYIHDPDGVCGEEKLNFILEMRAKDPMHYQANDSMIIMGDGNAYLHGKGELKYQSMELNSEYIRMNLDSSQIYAKGVWDSLNYEWKGKPVFKDGKDSYETNEITYNIQTQRGFIRHVVTQQGEGYIIADKTKKLENNEMLMADGLYTTCDDHDHPHFYLKMTKAKVKPGDYIASGPAYLVVGDVPLPLAVPFGFFPFTSTYSSGIIMPTFGDDYTRGL